MACCTNTYDFGCHSQCATLELSDLLWPSSGTFCLFFTVAGNTYTWETEGVEGYPVELSMQYLNEDAPTTFYFKDDTGQIITFDIDGTTYDCFKITSIAAGCGATEMPHIVTCSSDTIGVEGDLLVWDYSAQEWVRLPAGPASEVLTSNGAGTMPSYEPAAGGGTVTGASNGLNLEGTNVELGGALNEDTTIAAGALDYKVTSVPEANKTAEYEASQDLFGLFAQLGTAINGQGNRYVLTYDGSGDPESWLFQKVSNDSAVGGTYNSTIGYINLTTGIECYFEVTTSGLRMVTSDGTNLTGLTVTQATEVIRGIINGTEKLYIDSTGVTISNLTSAGDRLVFANLNGLLGIKTSAQATAMLDNMVGDSGAGGTKGLVPAPNAGDAAANKFLRADGTWAAAGGGTNHLVWMDSYTTISASNGIGYGTYPYIYFGGILIPGGTVQAGDIIEIKSMFRSNGGGTAGVMNILRDANAAPSSNVNYNVADSSGNKSFCSICSAAGVYHLGFNSAIYAAATGFTAPVGAPTGHNISNSIYDSFTFQSTGYPQLVDASMSWATDKYLVFCHTSSVAAQVTFMGGWVKIYRP